MPRILVTGAGGFVGRALCPALAVRGHEIIAALRRPFFHPPVPPGVEPQVLGDVLAGDGWEPALRGTDIVVHLAQRAHAPPDAQLLSDDVRQAAALARVAAAAGATRFVYLSSIKAMGETTAPGRPFRAGDPARPEDAYGRAKLASEQVLQEAAAQTGLELVVIRPPLVYGPDVGANFRALVRLAASGVPLPFAAIDNRRSLIFRDNLIDLIATATQHPEAAGQILLARDGDDLSTPALVRILAAAQGRPARLLPIPTAAFVALRALPKIGPAVARLTQSLQVDDSDTRIRLDWTPPASAEAGLTLTALALAQG